MKPELDPTVLACMARRLNERASAGEDNVSPRLLLEEARSELMLQINNNAAPAYNRALRAQHPDLAQYLSPLRVAVDQPARVRLAIAEAKLAAFEARLAAVETTLANMAAAVRVAGLQAPVLAAHRARNGAAS